jgi:hypothetical protein
VVGKAAHSGDPDRRNTPYVAGSNLKLNFENTNGDPVEGNIVDFGSVIEQGAFYSPNLAITPDGRSLYYIAGTHGDEAAGGIHIMRYDILERERIDLGRIGREVIPAFYSYGAKVHDNKVYFTVHGGDPSQTYLVIYDPDNKKTFTQ